MITTMMMTSIMVMKLMIIFEKMSTMIMILIMSNTLPSNCQT